MPVDADQDPLVRTSTQLVALAEMSNRHNLQESAQRQQFQQDLALGALKGLNIINGGGILALLTFMGHNTARPNQLELASAIQCFAGGLGANLLAYIFGYFAQSEYSDLIAHQACNDQRTLLGLAHEDETKGSRARGNTHLSVGIMLALASLGLFAAGAVIASTSFVRT